MRNKISYASAVMLLCLFISGCAAVESIFKAGLWSGVLMVAIVLAVIIFIIAKATKK